MNNINTLLIILLSFTLQFANAQNIDDFTPEATDNQNVCGSLIYVDFI